MQVGRKIYFEKSTGNVILDTGEREGDVVETTSAQDFESYVDLSQRVPETVGMIQLIYGQNREKFGIYEYHVESGVLVWDMTPMQIAEVIEQKTTAEQIAEMQSNQSQILMALVAGGLM